MKGHHYGHHRHHHGRDGKFGHHGHHHEHNLKGHLHHCKALKRLHKRDCHHHPWKLSFARPECQIPPVDNEIQLEMTQHCTKKPCHFRKPCGQKVSAHARSLSHRRFNPHRRGCANLGPHHHHHRHYLQREPRFSHYKEESAGRKINLLAQIDRPRNHHGHRSSSMPPNFP